MNRKHVFSGRIVDVVVDQVKLPDGRTVEREMVLHPGAVVIVPVVPRKPTGASANAGQTGISVNGRQAGMLVLLLRQFRHAAGGEILELPAGTLEKGESPDACAARELEEETGFRAGRMRALTSFWSSPGILQEKMHLYLAEDLSPGRQSLDEDESLDVIEMSVDDALAAVRDGRIADAKSIAGILYYASFCRDAP